MNYYLEKEGFLLLNVEYRNQRKSYTQ